MRCGEFLWRRQGGQAQLLGQALWEREPRGLPLGAVDERCTDFLFTDCFHGAERYNA
jgi:hypothetical protein